MEYENNIIRVKHLGYGFVDFKNPTLRQMEVLKVYQEHVSELEEVKLKIFNELAKKENRDTKP